jgi:HTH-type transcriptional regulator/antitoxin HigA
MSKTIRVRPIKNDEDHARALKEIERLWDAPGIAEREALDVLGTLVEVYEKARWPLEDPDPIEAIQFRAEQMGVETRELAKMIGSRHRLSDVLNRKRRLSVEMIQRLVAQLKIPAEVLLRDTRVEKRVPSTAAARLKRSPKKRPALLSRV